MKYFVIIYNRKTGAVEIRNEFDADHRSKAMQARFKLEKSYRNRPEVEVVVLGAESEDALARTHARYFRSGADLIRHSKDAYG